MMTLLAAVFSLVALSRPQMLVIGRARRRVRATKPADLAALAELTALGLVAGLPFRAALRAAGRHAPPALSHEVRRVDRAANLRGAAVAYAQAGGQLEPLMRLAARAMATGAPLAAAVTAYAAQIRNDERTRAVADARRLAVRLLFPLALLILPGFIVLIVGPVTLQSLARLDL